jgi:hypothetical protein
MTADRRTVLEARVVGEIGRGGDFASLQRANVGRRVMGYREQIEDEMVALVRTWLDGAEEHYGRMPHFDVFGVVAAVSYTPDDEEPEEGEAFSRDSVAMRFSDQRQWVQVGVLRLALQLAEGDGEE